jgi:hypothetical protein
MPNSGVTGGVRGESGQAIAGVHVRARATTRRGPEAILAVAGWVPGGLESSLRPCLGETTTGPDGVFHLQYPELDKPDLDIVLHTASGRRLSVTRVEGVIDQTLDVGVLTVRDDSLGWVPRSGAPPRDGTGVEPIIDNRDAWARAMTLVTGVQESINMLLFYLDTGRSLMAFPPGTPVPGTPGPTPGARLEVALEKAAKRGVTVRLRVQHQALGDPRCDLEAHLAADLHQVLQVGREHDPDHGNT